MLFLTQSGNGGNGGFVECMQLASLLPAKLKRTELNTALFLHSEY